MRIHCKHCGTSCPSNDPFAGFCCSGCKGVYAFIHEAGLENYYALQDRAGRPIDALEAEAAEGLAYKAILARAQPTERGHKTTLHLSGMTCRGCVWLVERIAKTSEGFVAAAVSLTSCRLELEWREGFDFDQFQTELRRFGYRLSDRAIAGVSFSPLTLRFILSILFAVNGCLVVLLRVLDIAPALDGLSQLFLIANLLLTFLIGSAVYLRPAWDGIRIRHFNSDLLPAIIHFIIFCLSLLEAVAGEGGFVFTVSFALIVPAFLGARMLADRFNF